MYDQAFFITVQQDLKYDFAFLIAIVECRPHKDSFFGLFIWYTHTHTGSLAVFIRDSLWGKLYDPTMDSKVDLIRSIYYASFAELNSVFIHRFCKWTTCYVKFRDIQSSDLTYRTPLTISYSHSNSISSVWIESLYGTVSVCVFYFFENLLTLDLHAYSILHLIGYILIGQMYEIVEDLSVWSHETDLTIFERVMRVVKNELWRVLHIVYQSYILFCRILSRRSINVTATPRFLSYP